MEQQPSTEDAPVKVPARRRSVTHSSSAMYYPGFSLGNGVDVAANGSIGPRLDSKPMFVSYPLRETVQYSIPMVVGGRETTFTLPLGLTVLSGPTGGGKSTLLRALGDVVVLNAVEPFDDIAAPEALQSFESVDEAFLYAISRTVTNRADAPLYAIDSLREALFETTGAAGSKGVIMPFFTKVTRVSNALAKMGMTMIASVNPMNDESDFVRTFLGYLSASVPCFLNLQSTTPCGDGTTFKGTITARGGDNHRVEQSFTIVAGGTSPARRVLSSDVIEIDPPKELFLPKVLSAQSINSLNQD